MHDNNGHRRRVKDRFRAEGLDSFDPVHALELLLFYAVPRRDTKPIARRLLDKYGSFYKVLEASYESLVQVEGVGHNTAIFLKLMNDTSRYYLSSRDNTELVLTDLNDYGTFLMNRFVGVSKEELYILCLDAKGKLLKCIKLASGTVITLDISPRTVVEAALSVNATSVILGHNHPGGFAFPSEADVFVTDKIFYALAAVDIELVDHIIVGDDDFVSMRQSGKLFVKQSGKLSMM